MSAGETVAEEASVAAGVGSFVKLLRLGMGVQPVRSVQSYVYATFVSNCLLILANFERPVLGCIEDDFCKNTLVLVRKLLERTTRFTHFCIF